MFCWSGAREGSLDRESSPPPASFYGRPINATERGNADGGFSCRQSPAIPGTHTERYRGEKMGSSSVEDSRFSNHVIEPFFFFFSRSERGKSHTHTPPFRLPFSSFSSTPDPPPTTALFLLLPFLSSFFLRSGRSRS